MAQNTVKRNGVVVFQGERIGTVQRDGRFWDFRANDAYSHTGFTRQTDAVIALQRYHRVKTNGLCEHDGCDEPASHLCGIGNERPHQRLCVTHTNQRVADDDRVWFRSLSP